MSSFSYDFSVLGGDARQVFLAEMLAESGRSLCHYALASQPNNCSSVSEHVSIVREAPSLEEACIHSGFVICPFPFTKNGADVSVENSIYRFSIQTLLHLLRRHKISQLMDAETWMNAKEAVKLGFADEILFRDGEKSVPEDTADTEMLFSRKAVTDSLLSRLIPKKKPEANKHMVPVTDLEKRLSLLAH